MNSQYPGLLLALDQPQRIIDSRTPYPSGIVSPLPIGTQVSPTSYNFRISGAVSTTGNTLPSVDRKLLRSRSGTLFVLVCSS